MSMEHLHQGHVPRSELRRALVDLAEGYYVVNRETIRVVAGPFGYYEDAEREADRRNAIEPATPGLLEVWAVE